MTAIPSENWPKAYLLEIHAQAIEHGYVLIQPISEQDALSLKSRLYRLRRRSDTSTASFIPPEYHLVNVGRWRDNALPIIYNRLPDGQVLPSITPVPAEVAVQLPHFQPASPAVTSPIAAGNKPIYEPPADANLALDPSEISSFVEKMMTNAAKRKGEEQ